MKILVVGNYKENPSEGMEVITAAVVNALRQDFGITVETRSSHAAIKGLVGIIRFNPELIIFTHGPGKGVLVLSRLMHSLTKSKIIWVASRPSLENCPLFLLKRTHVDHILTGNSNLQLTAIQKHSSAKLHSIIIGIDFGRLKTSNVDRLATRERILGKTTCSTTPLVIHVGHIRNNRGLEKIIKIKEIMGNKVEIAIIGSPSLTVDQEPVDKLKKAEISICSEYIDDLSAIYQCADCYVFPVDPEIGGAVDLPLSVIESLASGTPVISTRFGALPKALENFKGIVFSSYADIADDTVLLLQKLENNVVIDPITDEFDLKNIARKIMDIANSAWPENNCSSH